MNPTVDSTSGSFDAEMAAREKDARHLLSATMVRCCSPVQAGDPANFQLLANRLRRDEKGQVKLLVRHPKADVSDRIPDEKLHSLPEGIELLLDPHGPDKKWFARANAPIVPSAKEVEAQRVAKHETEIRWAWEAAPPWTREMLRMADIADPGHKKLILALARLFAMKPDEFPQPGPPPACAAAFFGVEAK